jgi:regulator of sirC expression with transglutaminase-like and TPR domain
LAEQGTTVLPLLEKAWEKNLDPLLQERVEQLTHQIQYNDVRRALARWAAEDGEDLLEAALLLDRYAYPERDQTALREKVAELRRAVWLELSQYLTPLEKVHVVNQVLFRHLGFAGLDDLARDPRAAYLGTLLETRKGNPLSLGLLYLILAQQLELPIYGVRFPQHPLLAVTEGYLLHFERSNLREHVLFYLYPFRHGAVVTARDIEDNLQKAGVKARPEFYLPVSNRSMFQEMLLILENLYRGKDLEAKATEVAGLRAVLLENALPAAGQEKA